MVNSMSNMDDESIIDDMLKNNDSDDDSNKASENNGALYIVIGVSSTLITTFVLAVIILWAWSFVNGSILGLNPPQALLTWEDEYRDLTGVNSLEGLDGTGVTLCIVDSGIDVSHQDLANIKL